MSTTYNDFEHDIKTDYKYSIDEKGNLYHEYCTGGIRGGSCWDDGESDPHYAYTHEDPSDIEFTVLDDILTKYCPNITFLMYKAISKLVHTDTETRYEYYGNSDNYVIMTISIRELYDFLHEKGMI